MYRVSNVSKYVCVCVFSSPWAIGVWSSKHWGFPMRDPQNGLFTMESPVKLDDLGKKMRLLISGTDIYIYIYHYSRSCFRRTEDGFINHTFAHAKVWKYDRTHFYHGFLKRHLKKSIYALKNINRLATNPEGSIKK